jgi:hypothetical protein
MHAAGDGSVCKYAVVCTPTVHVYCLKYKRGNGLSGKHDLVAFVRAHGPVLSTNVGCHVANVGPALMRLFYGAALLCLRTQVSNAFKPSVPCIACGTHC